MSLTRKQWNEMWTEVETIESLNNSIKEQDKPRLEYQVRCTKINDEVKRLKELIQSVIGQMNV